MAGYRALTLSALRSRHLVAGILFVGLVAAVFVGAVGLGVQAEVYALRGADKILGAHTQETALAFSVYNVSSNTTEGYVCVASASSSTVYAITGRHLAQNQTVFGQLLANSSTPSKVVELGSSLYTVVSVQALPSPLNACALTSTPPGDAKPLGKGETYVSSNPSGLVEHITTSLERLVGGWRLLGYASVAAASALTGVAFMWGWLD
ncbi:MAG: hypothetical protein QXI37_04385, partial [Thermoprotei archaeon]